MKIIYNNIIPFRGFIAINLFGVLFVRKKLNAVTINHEKIHTAQMKELGYILFYILYLAEFIIGIFRFGENYEAYMNISFEKEAYKHQYDLNYLETRKHYSQWRRDGQQKKNS